MFFFRIINDCDFFHSAAYQKTQCGDDVHSFPPTESTFPVSFSNPYSIGRYIYMQKTIPMNRIKIFG